GWRKDYWLMYNQLNFTTDAYKDAKAGHLPLGRGVGLVVGHLVVGMVGVSGVGFLLSRRDL
ncbi:MAG: hypothetical protein ACKO2Z_00850, partial [Sphaerospermopsis kisseleviana]